MEGEQGKPPRGRDLPLQGLRGPIWPWFRLDREGCVLPKTICGLFRALLEISSRDSSECAWIPFHHIVPAGAAVPPFLVLPDTRWM